jgi:hypothetical protein
MIADLTPGNAIQELFVDGSGLALVPVKYVFLGFKQGGPPVSKRKTEIEKSTARLFYEATEVSGFPAWINSAMLDSETPERLFLTHGRK